MGALRTYAHYGMAETSRRSRRMLDNRSGRPVEIETGTDTEVLKFQPPPLTARMSFQAINERRPREHPRLFARRQLSPISIARVETPALSVNRNYKL